MDDCLFCNIVAGKIPCKKVYEDELTLAFWDINPEAQVHVLVVPKKHHDHLLDNVSSEELAALTHAIDEVVTSLNIKESGFRVVTNCGLDGGQSVGHLHFHVFGGEKLPVSLWGNS